MKSEKLIVRIDEGRKRWLESEAKRSEKPRKDGRASKTVSALTIEAIDFLRARIEIEVHVRESLENNMRDFPDDFAGFAQWVRANDRLSPYGGVPVDRAGVRAEYNLESYVSAETFVLLRQWTQRKPEHREQFMQDVVLRLEFWLRSDALQPPLFPDEPAQSAPARPVRKAKATV